MTFELVMTCGDGAEPSLQQELALLGLTDSRLDRGALIARVTLEQAYRVCLWSRLAGRVLLPLFTAEGDNPDALYAQALAWNWDDVLSPRGTIAVHATAARQVKAHTQFLALRLKDAIVDACRERHGQRPSIDTDCPDVQLQVHATATGFQVSVDLSGHSLHRRGYRVAMTEAPLKETLAATLLWQAGWQNAEFSALLDPMCGSGTFLVEAAMVA
ncbi:MAG: 23S rRNA (guanine(2445)-N(2))/(guanine(2069)-N(7))-methyltransferase, partial [Moraxellaceae bacterium]|nr:23S rRNA (guanine(2445)-N(2))/(guanine(2069)-N(7))-methyltransferase [Moraxellaceae bacterium]